MKNMDEVKNVLESLGYTAQGSINIPQRETRFEDDDGCWCCGSSMRKARRDNSVQCGSCFEILIER